jgi:hypothetical protein
MQAAADDVWLLAEPLAGGAEFPARLLKIPATEVAHLHPLQKLWGGGEVDGIIAVVWKPTEMPHVPEHLCR